jgi:hypothetical protein
MKLAHKILLYFDVGFWEENKIRTVELSRNVVKRVEYFASLQTSVVITEEYNVMVKSEDFIGATEYVTL